MSKENILVLFGSYKPKCETWMKPGIAEGEIYVCYWEFTQASTATELHWTRMLK